MVDKLVSRNTIKLASSASAVNGYYIGYTIVLTRFNSITGKELVQRKQIVQYNGASRIATIDGIWDEDFIPTTSDTYKIVPTYPDNRVSINFAVQTLDYITSERYGKGLDPIKDLYLPSWLESARTCDTQSDVTVRVTSSLIGLDVGAVYKYTSGVLHWQGEVKSVNGQYVRFTKVLGKLSNKWNSWKSYPVGALVYEGDNLYTVTIAGPKTIKPVHTSGTINGLAHTTAKTVTLVSGSGPASLSIYTVGNPVQDINSSGRTISGYSLYDSDGVDYWRYIGWDEHTQRYVTRHQGNLMVDTSMSIFDNINSFLEHFGGILRYTAGQYHLEIEQGEGSIPNSENEPRSISADHIIGKIKISDEGIRSSYNSLTVAYADPANKFEAKNISFFNSEFLKTDRNVPKKGNLSIPGVTNYYNARLLADKFLIKSRFGLTVNLNMGPRGALLLAGKVIQIQHPRYGWVNKKFRIENITHNDDTTVDIVAKEYDDSFYVVSNISRPPAAALAAEANTKTDIGPGSLTATSIEGENAHIGGIELKWANDPKADSTVSTEIFSSFNARLFINVISVTGGYLLATMLPHGLSVGDFITSQSSMNGLTYGKTYYVRTVPTDTSFTLAESPTDLDITYFESGTDLSLKLLTASIITTLATPATSYIDVIPTQEVGVDNLIRKFYWIRHKVTKR